MHLSAWNFTAGSKGCVYQVSWHGMAMSLSLGVVLAEVNWDFLQIFQQKSAQLGYQKAKNKNITIWVMLPKLNSYVEKQGLAA